MLLLCIIEFKTETSCKNITICLGSYHDEVVRTRKLLLFSELIETISCFCCATIRHRALHIKTAVGEENQHALSCGLSPSLSFKLFQSKAEYYKWLYQAERRRRCSSIWSSSSKSKHVDASDTTGLPDTLSKKVADRVKTIWWSPAKTY